MIRGKIERINVNITVGIVSNDVHDFYDDDIDEGKEGNDC